MKLQEMKDIWIDKKTGKTRIIDGMGKYIPDDKKIIKDLIDKNKDEFLYSRLENGYISFGFDTGFNLYTINSSNKSSFKKFKTFDEFWKYFTETYRKN